jgi:hypothetical protein
LMAQRFTYRSRMMLESHLPWWWWSDDKPRRSNH